jgi:hypothetical protein
VGRGGVERKRRNAYPGCRRETRRT